MGYDYALRLAREADLGAILGLIRGASDWLAAKGTDQWQRPWPTRRERDARIRAAILADKTWILTDGDVAAATITTDWQGRPAPGLPELWDERALAQPAVYAHRMVVRREPPYQGQGLGGRLLDWAGRLGRAAYDAAYIRVDVWSTNYDLHGYYKELGFDKLGTVGEERTAGCPSGALFQKPAAGFADTAAAFAVVSGDAGRWSARARAAVAVVTEN